jgi:hypothetical protein
MCFPPLCRPDAPPPHRADFFNRTPWPEDFPPSFLRVYSVHPPSSTSSNKRPYSVMDLISIIFQASVMSFEFGKLSMLWAWGHVHFCEGMGVHAPMLLAPSIRDGD